MHKLKKIKLTPAFGIVMAFVTAFTCMFGMNFNNVMAEDGNYSVSIAGEGTGKVTISYNDEEHTITEGNYNAKIESGTEVSLKIEADSSIASVKKDGEIIKEIPEGTTYYDVKDTIADSDNISYEVSFKKSDNKESSDGLEAIDESVSESETEVSDNSDVIDTDVNMDELDVEKYKKSDEFDEDDMSEDDSKTVLIKYLYAIPGAVSENDTITSALIDKDPKTTIYTQLQERATVYKAKDGTYKILADTPFANGLAVANAYDWDCARGNDFGETITDGVSYDKDTKIITIQPDVFKQVKKEQKTDGDADEDFSQLQFQFLIPVNVQDDLKINTTVEDDSHLIKTAFNKYVSLRPFMTARFQLATDETRENITEKNIQVYLNGSDEPVESEAIAYDSTTGELGISAFGANISNIKIKITPTKKSLFKSASAANGVAVGNTKVGQLNVLAYLNANTKDVFTVGSAINVTGKFGNNSYPAAPLNGTPAGLWNRSRSGFPSGFTTVDWVVGDGGESAYTESALGTPASITMNGSTVDFTFRDANGNSYGNWVNGGNGAAGTDPTTFNGGIQAFCHHIKTSVGTVNTSNARAIRYPTCTLRVLDKRTINGYVHVVFGYETNLHMFGGSAPQTVGTVFELAFKKDTKGKFCIQKESSNTSLSDNNGLYTFKGATYGVYTDKAFKNLVTTLSIGENGQSNTVSVDPGTYYIKETVAPKGYAMDKMYYTINVTLGQNKRYIGFKDTPQSVVAPKLIHKTDSISGANLQNVVYKVNFYKGYNISNISQLNGVSPSATWNFKTDANGEICVSSEFLTGSGNSALYTNAQGSTVLPAGVVTMQETSAASANYSVNSTVYYANISTNTTGKEYLTMTTQELTNTPTNTKAYGIYFQKCAQTNGKNQASQSPMDMARLTGTTFLHTLPNGSTETLTYSPTFGNYDFGKSPAWSYYTEITNLPVGVHSIKELTPSQDTYYVNPTVVKFRVNSDGSIDVLSGISDSENTVLKTQMGDVHNASGTTTKTNTYVQLLTVCDIAKGYKYHINKKDTNGDVIKGVQFSVYTSNDCSEDSLVGVMETDENGDAYIDGLQPNVFYYIKETHVPDGYVLPTDHAKHLETVYDSTLKKVVDKTIEDVWDARLRTYLNGGVNSGGIGYIDKYESLEDTKHDLATTDYQTGKVYDTIGHGSYSGNIKNNNLVIRTDFTNERVGPKALYIRKVAKSSVQVTDETNYPHGTGTYLNNTQFLHTKPNGSTETITYTAGGTGNSMLNTEGYYKITGLDVGVHTLQEKKAGSNIYSVNNTVIKFEVKKNGIIDMISGFDGNTDVSYIKTANDNSGMILITEEDSLAETNLTIVKKDYKSKKALPGAVFTLYSDVDCTKKVDEQTTNSSGALTFKNLKDGTNYYLKETKAPAGYTYNLDSLGNNKVYSFIVRKSVSSGMTVSISNDLVWNNTEATSLGKDYEISKTQTISSNGSLEDNIQITITNKTPFYSGNVFPKTGSSGMLITTVCGLAVAGVAIAYKKKKK